VEVHRIAIDEQLQQRHGDDDQQAARIAPDLNYFLARHGQDAAQVHATLPGFASRPAVKETKTSSRLGEICSSRLTRTCRDSRACRIPGMAALASATTACRLL